MEKQVDGNVKRANGGITIDKWLAMMATEESLDGKELIKL
jgi:hypothetical protein